MKNSAFMAAALAGALGGCATVTRGTMNQIVVDSDPPNASARASLGHSCPATPCTWEVSRRSEFVVSFSKPGYRSIDIPVSTRIAGAGAVGFAGNVLIGGLVGMGVDAATGSTLEHYPNPVVASLVPLRRSGGRGIPARRRDISWQKPRDGAPLS